MMGGNTNNEVWARRLALQITTQLPENEEDAIKVLRYARDLISFVSRGRTCTLTIAAANQSIEKK